MKTTRLAFLALLILTAAAAAFAAVQPVVITLTGTSTDYIVPANKVLVIENAYSGNDYSNHQGIILLNTTVTNVLYIDNWFKKITPIQPALKLAEGWTVRAMLESSDEHFIVLFGLLVDPSDLYAGIQNEFQNVSFSASSLRAALALASPRQPIIELEESSNFSAWTEATEAVVAATTNRADYTVMIPPGSPVQSYRARVVSRVGSGGMKQD